VRFIDYHHLHGWPYLAAQQSAEEQQVVVDNDDVSGVGSCLSPLGKTGID
jgi:hypothetical protein